MARWHFSQRHIRHGEPSTAILCHLGISSTPGLAIFWAVQPFWHLPKGLLLFLACVSPITASLELISKLSLCEIPKVDGHTQILGKAIYIGHVQATAHGQLHSKRWTEEVETLVPIFPIVSS